MAIKLRTRMGKNRVGNYLEYNVNGKRFYERLPELSYPRNPKTLEEKNEVAEKKKLIERILHQKSLKLLANEYDFKPIYNNKINFLTYLDEYIENYPNKGDLRNYCAMRKKLKEFVGKSILPAFEIDEAFLRRFVRHLEKNLNYETPADYFGKLKRVLKLATKQNIFRVNPADDIKLKKFVNREKDVLTESEILILANTPSGNSRIKDAFLFAAYTGLRYVDIKRLTWRNINADCLTITQSKTQRNVSVPIHISALTFLGERGLPNDLVFKLPSHTGCLKSIRKWVKDAGINKHITFHCARHSFGTNIQAKTGNIYVTSKLLGHTKIGNTARYARMSLDVLQNAINTLPNL